MSAKSICAAVALALCLVPPARADGEGHVRSVHEHTDIRIHADSTYEQTLEFTLRAVDQIGANGLGQQYLDYQAGRQTFELLEAETLPAHGAPVRVPTADIKVQDGMLGGISFPEKKLVQITFSKLAAGDAIHLRYRLTQKTLDLPGGMSKVMLLRGDLIRDDTSIAVHYPATLAVKFIEHQLTAQGDTLSGAERTRRWSYRSGDTITPEPAVVNSWRHTPHLMLSTFASWKAIADGYQAGAAGKAAVTPELRALADDISAGAPTPRAQSARLHDWVRRNIRYIASYVGDGGYVPNVAASILRRRYGDCKDHATLLEALLEARGIHASQVLLQADLDNYVLPPLPVLWFNHVITFVPALELYLDATDSAVPFGLLPEPDADKPVLATKDFSAIGHTPAARPEQMRVERRVQIAFAQDGSALRTSEVIGYGLAAVAVRQFMGAIGPGREHDWVKRLLNATGLEGDGTLELVQPTRIDALGFRLTERIRNYVSQPEAGVLAFAPGLGGPLALAPIMNRYTEALRLNDTRCEAFELDDRIEISMPAAFEVLYLPRDLIINEGPLSFAAHYERSGNSYRMTRSVRASGQRSWCTAQEYQALRPAMNRINKALGARLVYVHRDDDTGAATSAKPSP